MGIGPGDEVITHPNTFFATAEAIWIAGATAVFVDCDPSTKCIDPARIEAAITPKTKAIIPVHLYGQCADMPAIRKIADAHNLRVIEDNAQAIDGAGDGFTIGQLSDATSVSFIIQKNLGTFGDGGALLTNDADIDARVRKLRNHGSAKRNVHSFGFNSRLDDLHAGVLSAKLKHIHAWNDLRIQWAARYTAGLEGATHLELPHVRPGYRHVFHLYVIETKNPAHRDQLAGFPRAERDRCQDALLDRDSPAGRLPMGQGCAHRRLGRQRRAQRRRLRQLAHVSGVDRSRSGLRRREGSRMGSFRTGAGWQDRARCSMLIRSCAFSCCRRRQTTAESYGLSQNQYFLGLS